MTPDLNRTLRAIQDEPWKIEPFQPGRTVIRHVRRDPRTGEYSFKYEVHNRAPSTWIPSRTGRRTHRRRPR